MSSLAEYIAEQLCEEGLEVTSEQIQTFIDSHEESLKPKAKSAKSKAGKTKAAAEEEHTCERTINGKETTRICGKRANNELNGMWFCGTEKSGCYKTALGKAATAPKSKTAAKTVASKTVAKASSKTKAASVIQKVQKKERLNLVEVPSGSGVWVDLNHHRMVYSQDPKETYGILDDDDETVLPLTEEAIAFAEAHGVPIREAEPVKKAPKSKAVAKAKAAPPSKAVAKAKTAKTVAPKAVAKAAPKAAPKGKAVPKPEPKKVVPKGKTKKVKEDEELLEDLQQEAEDVEVEPNVEEEGEVPAEEEEAPEIDLGDGDEAPGAEEEEDVDEDEAPDVEEADEGEAADEEEVEEELEEGDEE